MRDEVAARNLLDGVSRETTARLTRYVEELSRWQRVKNLVGRSTLDGIWTRHVADSLQLLDLADGEIWADLGSGAGFPGLVLAIARPAMHMHLIESDRRKAAFLRHAARVAGAEVSVWDDRAEAVLPRLQPLPTVVTSRAMAPLPDLLRLGEAVLAAGAVGLFPKGAQYQPELTAAAESWRFDVDVLPSRTDTVGRIIRIRGLQRRAQSQPGEPS